jgi:serine/threonine protein kinase
MSSEVTQILHHCKQCGAILDVSDQEPFSEIVCPACETPQVVRSRFDHFEISEEIASGGMGTVYRANDVHLNRIVALKLLRREFSEDEEYIQKLETEAKITASVNHPNVVKVFSFGVENNQYYIAMELVDRGSLDDLMGIQQRIAEIQVLDIAIQVAEGLRAAFQAGLIHRDVKPGNILFANDRTAKIVDFGLAMPLEQAREAEEEIWGTPYYVAPEKLNHDPEDFRSDIYSLGGTLFHALAGRPPFEAENASLVALKHLKSQVVSLQTFAPDVSEATSYVINRTLAKNPDDRYASYDELIEHLQYARTHLVDQSGKPRQRRERLVVEGDAEQHATGFVLMGVIGFVILLGVVLFFSKDTILSRRESVAELREKSLRQAQTKFEESFSAARQKIIGGDYNAALEELVALDNTPNLPQPLKNWVILNQGIVILFQNRDASSTFEKIAIAGLFSEKPEDAELANFFLDVTTVLNSSAAINPSIAESYSGSNHASAALFVFALREWNRKNLNAAGKLFSDYLKVTPTENWAWISDYRPIAEKYLSAFNELKDLIPKLAVVKTLEERQAALKLIQQTRSTHTGNFAVLSYLDSAEQAVRNGQPVPTID